MRKILIIIGLLVSLMGYGQDIVNKRVIVDSLSTKIRINNGTAAGIFTTAALNVGGTSLTIDSIGLVNGRITFYHGPDTLGVHIIATDIVDLADYAVMLTDTADMLANYALLSEAGGGGVAIGDVRDEIADSLNVLRPLTQKLATVRTMMTFGGGGGNAGDTTVFTTSSLYGSTYWGGSLSFHVDTMVVHVIHGLGLDTLDVQISWDDNLLDGTPTNLNTVALPIGRYAGNNLALTSGQMDVAFANAVIPPGKTVWCTTPYVPAAALKRKPTYLSVTLVGHLQ